MGLIITQFGATRGFEETSDEGTLSRRKGTNSRLAMFLYICVRCEYDGPYVWKGTYVRSFEHGLLYG